MAKEVISSTDIPSVLPTWKKTFMSAGAIEEYEAKREQLIALFDQQQQELVIQEEAFLRKQILANSGDFSPQRNIGYLKSLEREHSEILEQENAFQQVFLQWAQENYQKSWFQGIVMPLLVVLGISLTLNENTYEISLADDMERLTHNIEAMQKIQHLGFTGTMGPRSSQAFVLQKVEQFKQVIIQIREAIDKGEQMKTPEQLADQFLQTLKEHDAEKGLSSHDKIMTKQAQIMLEDYAKFYAQRKEELEQRCTDLEEVWKQVVSSVIRQAEKEGAVYAPVEEKKRENTFDAMDDDELERYGSIIHDEKIALESKQKKYQSVLEKRSSVMADVLKEDFLGADRLAARQLKHVQVLDTWRARTEGQHACLETLQTNLNTIQDVQSARTSQKARRALEKLEKKWQCVIEDLMAQYKTIQTDLLGNEEKEIEKKRKHLGERLAKGEKLDLMQATQEIEEREKQYRAGKDDPAFQMRVRLAIQTRYKPESREYALVKQGLFGLSDGERAALPGELAKQEQEGALLDTSGGLRTSQDQIGLAIKQVGVKPLPRQPLTTGPEYDRIMQYRKDFKTEIKETTKTPTQLIKIAEDLIKQGQFSLRTQAGLTVAHFAIPGFTGGFATSDQVFKDKANDPDNMLSEYEYDNKVLSKGKKHLTKLQGLRSNNLAQWKDPIKTSVEQLAAQGVVYDQGGDLHELIALLMTQTGLNESDTLAVYMYLTGQYGWYRTGQCKNNSRGYVCLLGDDRRFVSVDGDNNRCSLLFAVADVPEGQGTPPELHTAQIALRTQRPDEKLPDGSDFWDACDALKNDPTFFRYGVNAAGDATATFVEPNLTCRIPYLRTDGMKEGEYDVKNDYKSHTDKNLMPTTTSTGSKSCIYKKTIDTMKPAWKKQMDNDCYVKGCRRQTKAELDEILNSLAKRLGITYDATSTNRQQVIRAYMYLKGSLGRERLNTDYTSGKNGDMYGQINGSKISVRSILFCHFNNQGMLRDGDGRYDCSIPLMCY